MANPNVVSLAFPPNQQIFVQAFSTTEGANNTALSLQPAGFLSPGETGTSQWPSFTSLPSSAGNYSVAVTADTITAPVLSMTQSFQPSSGGTATIWQVSAPATPAPCRTGFSLSSPYGSRSSTTLNGASSFM